MTEKLQLPPDLISVEEMRKALPKPFRLQGLNEPIALVTAVSDGGMLTLEPAPGHTAEELASMIRSITGPVPLGFSIGGEKAK